MYGMSFVTAFLCLYMLIMAAWAGSLATNADNAMIANQAGHLAVYSSFIAQYANSNPGYTGSVSDAAAGLPIWFKKSAGEQNYVAGGASYTYLAPKSRSAGMSMARVIGGGAAGINDAGVLTLPGSGSSGRPVAGAVPTGSLVIIR